MQGTITIDWQSPTGLCTPGTDADQTNPIWRTIDGLIGDGKPAIADARLCFFAPSEPAPERMQTGRWLGVFVLWMGGRISFSPGFASGCTTVTRFQGNSRQYEKPFVLDHLTLESDWNDWHITEPKAKNHLSGGKTKTLGDGRVLWFAMSVGSEATLRELKAHTTVNRTAPATDSIRRIVEFQKIVDGKEYSCVWPDPAVHFQNHAGFLHFAIVVGPKGFPSKATGELVPFGVPYLKNPPPQQVLRAYRILLGTTVEIEVWVSRLPGALTGAVIPI